MSTALSSKVILLFSALFLFQYPSRAQQLDSLAAVPLDTLHKAGKWNFIPILYAQPEIGVGFGARAVKIFRDTPQSRPSTVPFTFIYTTKQQTIANVRSDLWYLNNRYHFSSLVGYQNYPFKFYGIGNQAPLGAEEFYTTRILEFFVAFEKRILEGLYLGGRYEFRYENTIQKEANKLLDQNKVLGSEGQRSSGIGVSVIYDTRDNIYQPAKGFYHQLSALTFPKALGSRYSFNRYRADLRHYVRLLPSHIIAIQAQLTFTTGTIPFQQLAQIGGPDLMRGYFQGRYRDRHMMVYQAEYRLPIPFKFTNRFKVAGFASAGQVAEHPGNFSLNKFKYAGGVGLRYRFNEEGLNIRLDVGVGQATYFYFAFNEAF
jgi:outer membrane protein assembly factor BamA